MVVKGVFIVSTVKDKGGKEERYRGSRERKEGGKRGTQGGRKEGRDNFRLSVTVRATVT